MDFLDPKKQRAHVIRIIVGYVLIGIALILTATILLYQAYGFGVDRKGNVIQNGLVFISSTPNPANVYVNGEKRDDTNVRMLLSSGQYTFEVKRDGYRDWRRAVTVEGGSVDRFDYPFLLPSSLQTTEVKKYDKQPPFTTQSPDRKWVLVNTPNTAEFDVYDISDRQKVAESLKKITIPDSVFTTAAGMQHRWELVQWSTDNRHVIVRHHFQKDGQPTFEYVLLDREKPDESVNLTKAWGVNPTTVELQDQKHDKYYLFDKTAQTLSTATIENPTPKAYASEVLAFKSYGNDVMLYATKKDTPDGKASIIMQQGDQPHTIRTVPAAETYLVNLTKYEGDWYVAAGTNTEGRVYVYKNPVEMLKEDKVSTPVRVLKVPGVSYISFSSNARFIMAENGTNFSVYDAENEKGYTYTAKATLDKPQEHATWMDGHRIIYTSNGRLHVFDFDGANAQTLLATNSSFLPAFDRDYENLYTITAGDSTGASVFQQTPMRTTEDQ